MSSAGNFNEGTRGARFRLAMASCATGMGVLDIEGRWLEVSPAIERMLGRSAASLVGDEVVRCMPQEDATRLAQSIARLADHENPPLSMDTRFLRGDGSECWARLDIAPRRDDGSRAVYLVAHLDDAGARGGALQARNAALERELADASAALAALHCLQDSFAHGVSHDLRAPLRAIDSFSALLSAHLDDVLDDTARDYLGRIRGATTRMVGLIDGLLELSGAMRAEQHLAPVDLGLLIDWAHAELADAEPGRNADIVVQPGLQVLGDERQLRLLTKQLLHNAWKFSYERDRVRIEVNGERRGDRVVVAVRDHGSGFDMRYADKLFEPFQRLHGPEQAGGNGIGLAIVRCIAERHGGRAWAQSEPGTGSTFFIELPAVPAAENEA